MAVWHRATDVRSEITLNARPENAAPEAIARHPERGTRTPKRASQKDHTAASHSPRQKLCCCIIRQATGTGVCGRGAERVR